MEKKLTPEERKKYQDAFTERLPSILKLDPIVTIILGDKEYKLELDNRAAKDIYKDTGFNMLGSSIRSDILNPILVGSILHRALQRHHKAMTAEKVDTLIEFRKYLYIRDKILSCLELFCPDMADMLPKEQEETTEEDPQ